MFAPKEKPLPVAVLKPEPSNNSKQTEDAGIHLGEGYYWNPEALPNGHIVAIGASGSGKTQTLKAIAFSLRQTYPEMQVILLDFHGDQEIIGETCYPIHMASPHGINPLVVNLDPEGGESNLQAIQMAGILKKSLRLGPNQEGMLIEIIKTCYLKRGIVQERQETWSLEPSNFDDIEEELNRRVATAFQDEEKKELAESINLKTLPIDKPNTSGIYFIFHQNQLVYIGAARDIQKRIDGHHHIRYLLKDHYPGEKIEIRYYEHLSDWQELIKLENYLIQLHKPPLNQTTLRTECKESQKLKLKLAATFQYGVFSRPQPEFNEKLVRIDLSKLPTELRTIAAESLAWQLMNQHRLMGEIEGKLPRTFLEATGKGCSRKLISKWKKQKLNQKFPDNNSGDRHIEERAAAISASPTIIDIPSSVNSLQLTDRNLLMTVKAWSYLAAAGIAVSLVGCELIPLNNNRSTENIAIASVTAPITPLTPIPERRKNRLEPRNIKIELTLSNPQDLKVKPGDKISAGQVLSDRVDQRNRLQAKKKQLQLSLEKLNLPLTPIAQPKPIPEISPLPPVSYAEEEAAIKLKQQKLTEAKRAIALQQKKIDSLTQLQASPSHRSKKEGNLKLILEHERANLANLEAAKNSAQIQLEVQESKLTTAKEKRAYIEYQRQLEQTRRAIAIEQQHQAIQRQEAERERLLAEREYSQAQIETQIQTLDYQIEQLSSVRAPYEGTVKKIKWTGQSDHNFTAVVTLSVTSQQSAVSGDNSERKPISDTQAKQTTKTQP